MRDTVLRGGFVPPPAPTPGDRGGFYFRPGIASVTMRKPFGRVWVRKVMPGTFRRCGQGQAFSARPDRSARGSCARAGRKGRPCGAAARGGCRWRPARHRGISPDARGGKGWTMGLAPECWPATFTRRRRNGGREALRFSFSVAAMWLRFRPHHSDRCRNRRAGPAGHGGIEKPPPCFRLSNQRADGGAVAAHRIEQGAFEVGRNLNVHRRLIEGFTPVVR